MNEQHYVTIEQHYVTIGNTTYIGLWSLWYDFQWLEGEFTEARCEDAWRWGGATYEVRDPFILG